MADVLLALIASADGGEMYGPATLQHTLSIADLHMLDKSLY